MRTLDQVHVHIYTSTQTLSLSLSLSYYRNAPEQIALGLNIKKDYKIKWQIENSLVFLTVANTDHLLKEGIAWG